jgi:MFS family permease
MTAYLLFLRSYPRHVGFGFVMTLFSSLGQTFLISLYVPHILAELGISNSLFGSLYAVATVSSSLLLMTFGGRIDHSPLNQYVYKTVAALGLASLALGLVHHVLLLPVALLGIRFAGQGLMSHISQTVMGRYFEDDRGKALSLAALGYPVGEMIFPIIITLLIPLVGWRISLMLNAVILVGFLIPTLFWVPFDELSQDSRAEKTNNTAGKATAQWGILKSRAFWILAPAVVLLSFTNTGVFFYQLVLAETRGWSPEWYSMIFAGYAVSRFVFGLFGGTWVDRFSAQQLVPLMLLPLILGLIILALIPQHWAAVAFLLLAGITIGSSSPIKAATIAELHGTESLGGVRSVYTAFMVLGTALGPMCFGYFLDAGLGFTLVLLGAAFLLGIASLNSLRTVFKAGNLFFTKS